MRTLCVLALGLCAVAPLGAGCGGSSSSEKVITYQGPAEDAPKPKGMMRRGYDARQPGQEGAQDAAAPAEPQEAGAEQ